MMFEHVGIADKIPQKSGQYHEHDGKGYVSVYTAAGLTANVPVVIDYDADGDAGKQFITKTPATLASAVNLIGVPQAAISSLSYGWVQVFGEAEAALAEAVSAGDYLGVINAGTSYKTNGTTRTVYTSAAAVDATTAAATATILMFGQPVEVSASS